MGYQGQDGKDLSELCHNIQKCQAHGITRIRCQSGGAAVVMDRHPSLPPKDALDGIDLDSKKYLCNTLKLFDGIRSKVSFEVALCHDVHERLKPTEAIEFTCELERFACSPWRMT